MAPAIERITSPTSVAHPHWMLVMDKDQATFDGDFPADDAGLQRVEDYNLISVDIQIEDDGPSNTAEVRLTPYQVGAEGDTGGQQSDPWVKADMPAEPARLSHVAKVNVAVVNNIGNVRIFFTACERGEGD